MISWPHRLRRRGLNGGRAWVLLLAAALPAARAQPLGPMQNFGPYDAVFLAGGIGLAAPLSTEAPLLKANAPWSMAGWLRNDRMADGPLVVAAIGQPGTDQCRCLVLDHGRLELQLAAGVTLRADKAADLASWHAIAVTYDGHTTRLYLDGEQKDARDVATVAGSPKLLLAPESIEDLTGARHFGGALAVFSLYARALDGPEVARFSAHRPDFSLVPFHQVGVGWPWQQRAWRGLQEPQPAWTLPHGNAPFSKPLRSPDLTVTAGLQAVAPDRWTVGGWRLAPVPTVDASAQVLSRPQFPDAAWYTAVVPGTVLTTLIANGVYPDPDYGLNNLAIPESLSRQDYWYRSHFVVPADLAGRQLTLTFNGINYAAEVWFNGARLGAIRGAFIRGIFDVTATAHPGGDNVLVVRVSPPPHPGIPHEKSIVAGPGQNGGNLAIDGPTFIATEGWDWIPAIRDRDTGIWQNVELAASGMLRLLDPQIITLLPLPRTDTADIVIHVPVENRGAKAVKATVEVSFAGVHASKAAVLAPGVSQVTLDPAEFPQLHLTHPRLWWPNGYGAAELYTMTLAVNAYGARSDSRSVRFGIRQITYELSLFDHLGNLRRVEVDPAAGSARGEQLVDVRHEAIKRTANGWAESLTRAGETSPAVRDIGTTSLTPYLAIRVNGVRIAARGGSWGMDDSRKRSGRQHLEPFFRLHRQAHLDIIRNWLGQNTEEVFYDLADEYGLLVLNDFWDSTQDFQVEPQDPQLFLENAADVIDRFRNHPSIAVWFGRNEGVPQPIINEGLARLTAQLDGTRYYTGSSNTVNLQGSGPYNWRPPEQYFTDLARGFSVEVGTPSLSSLDTLRATIPPADRWPLGDTYAYHDWHHGGNGDTATFMQALQADLGAPKDLEDFERKAQLMNYVSYRAIFEGFQAHLWTRNSGRLLWMTQPAWPSNSWQIYTSDYDTPAAYYAVAKACEPLHAQLNLPDFTPAVINVSRDPRPALRLRSRVLSLDNRLLLERIDRLDAPANAATTLAPLDLDTALAREGLVLVELTLTDANGTVASTNLYWQARTDADQRRLAALAQQALQVRAGSHPGADGSVIDITLTNRGRVPALLARLTLLDSAGNRVLPAYYSDNYVSLLPGQSRTITARCPATGKRCSSVALRGWNVVPQTAGIEPHTAGKRGTSAMR